MRSFIVAAAFAALLLPNCSCEDESKSKSKVLATTTTPDGRKLELVVTSGSWGWGHFGDRACSNAVYVAIDGKRAPSLDSNANSCTDARRKLAQEEGRIVTRDESGVLLIATQGTKLQPRAETYYLPKGLGLLRDTYFEGDIDSALAKMKPFDEYLYDRLRGNENFLEGYNDVTERDSLAEVFTDRDRVARHARMLVFNVGRCEVPRRVSALLLEVDEAAAVPALFEGSFACAAKDSRPEVVVKWEKATDVRGLLLEKKPPALARLVLADLKESKHTKPKELDWLGTLAAALQLRDAVPLFERKLEWPDPPSPGPEARHEAWLSRVEAIAKIDPPSAANLLIDALVKISESSECVYPNASGGASDPRSLASYVGFDLRELRSTAVDKQLASLLGNPKVSLQSRQIARILLELWNVPLPAKAIKLAECQRQALENERADAGADASK